MHISNDRVIPHAKIGAAVFQPAAVADEYKLKGFYPASLYRPLPRYREMLINLRDELEEQRLQALQGNSWDTARVAELNSRLAEIPMELIDEDVAVNLVPDVGARLILDQALAGSAYTASAYMGLVSSTGYTSISNSDLMSSHSGWLEAGNANAPTYSGARKAMAWNAASGRSKSLSAALTFSFTGSGTVKGCFMVLGSGASSTVDNTGGVLGSAGLFTGGDKVVQNGDSLAVSYSIQL